MGLRSLESLKRFPANRIDKSALVPWPKGIPTFPQFIKVLSLEKCKLSNDRFPKDLSNLLLLKKLYLGGNTITSLPECCGTLSNLGYLSVEGCTLLQSVVGVPPTLKRRLSDGNMERFDSWGSDRYISFAGCPELAEIEGCYKRVSVGELERVIKLLELMDLEPSLAESDLYIEVINRCGILTTWVPIDKLPGCFSIISEYTGDDIIYFTVPDNPSNIQGLTLAFVYTEGREHYHYYNLKMTIINKTKNKELNFFLRDDWSNNGGRRDKGVVWMWHIKLGITNLLLEPRDHLTFKIHNSFSKFHPNEFAVMVVYKEEEDDCEDRKLVTQQHNNIIPSPFTRLYCYFSNSYMTVSRC